MTFVAITTPITTVDETVEPSSSTVERTADAIAPQTQPSESKRREVREDERQFLADNAGFGARLVGRMMSSS